MVFYRTMRRAVSYSLLYIIIVYYSPRFDVVAASPKSDKIPMQLLSFLFITALISHAFENNNCLTLPKKTNNKPIEPVRNIMLRTLNGEARKHDTRPTDRFQLHQTSVNILYLVFLSAT